MVREQPQKYLPLEVRALVARRENIDQIYDWSLTSTGRSTIEDPTTLSMKWRFARLNIDH